MNIFIFGFITGGVICGLIVFMFMGILINIMRADYEGYDDVKIIQPKL